MPAFAHAHDDHPPVCGKDAVHGLREGSAQPFAHAAKRSRLDMAGLAPQTQDAIIVGAQCAW